MSKITADMMFDARLENMARDIAKEAVMIGRKKYVEGGLDAIRTLRDAAKHAKIDYVHLKWLDTAEKGFKEMLI